MEYYLEMKASEIKVKKNYFEDKISKFTPSALKVKEPLIQSY